MCKYKPVNGIWMGTKYQLARIELPIMKFEKSMLRIFVLNFPSDGKDLMAGGIKFHAFTFLKKKELRYLSVAFNGLCRQGMDERDDA